MSNIYRTQQSAAFRAPVGSFDLPTPLHRAQPRNEIRKLISRWAANGDTMQVYVDAQDVFWLQWASEQSKKGLGCTAEATANGAVFTVEGNGMKKQLTLVEL